jgi:hypothetical protein
MPGEGPVDQVSAQRPTWERSNPREKGRKQQKQENSLPIPDRPQSWKLGRLVANSRFCRSEGNPASSAGSGDGMCRGGRRGDNNVMSGIRCLERVNRRAVRPKKGTVNVARLFPGRKAVVKLLCEVHRGSQGTHPAKRGGVPGQWFEMSRPVRRLTEPLVLCTLGEGIKVKAKQTETGFKLRGLGLGWRERGRREGTQEWEISQGVLLLAAVARFSVLTNCTCRPWHPGQEPATGSTPPFCRTGFGCNNFFVDCPSRERWMWVERVEPRHRPTATNEKPESCQGPARVPWTLPG